MDHRDDKPHFEESEVDIQEPQLPSQTITALDVLQGAPIPPLKRLEIIDEDSWEDITAELVFHSWKPNYSRVVRCGGGGDMGRDVIAYNPDGGWENFQCKHYDHPITLNEAVLEIGKLIYYSWKRYYIPPKKYYFVSPQGVATLLLNCLMNTDKLKENVIERWEKQCRTKITTKEKVVLEGELLRHLEDNIDFGIFDLIPPVEIVSLHSLTPHHTVRFGSSARVRPKPQTPPSTPVDSEVVYTKELMAAFSDAAQDIVDQENISDYQEFEEEYMSARRNYYSADSLDQFSRDWLPPGSYDDLLDECKETISPVVNSDHKDGYTRYLKSSQQAVLVDYSSHPLNYCIKVQDKKGLCHKLVNKKKIKWVK